MAKARTAAADLILLRSMAFNTPSVSATTLVERAHMIWPAAIPLAAFTVEPGARPAHGPGPSFATTPPPPPAPDKRQAVIAPNGLASNRRAVVSRPRGSSGMASCWQPSLARQYL